MSIFGLLRGPGEAQVGEIYRLDASETFVAKGQPAISVIEIEPEAGAGYVDVTSAAARDRFLDWVFSTPGAKTATVRVTLADTSQSTGTHDFTIRTAAEEDLLTTDNDLVTLESDAMRYLPDGRSTWNHIHREVRKQILEDLSDNRIFKTDGSDLAIADLKDKSEVRRWATHKAAELMFLDLSNSEGDTFFNRAKSYSSKVNTYRAGAFNSLRVDIDQSGSVASDEIQDGRSVRLTRRT